MNSLTHYVGIIALWNKLWLYHCNVLMEIDLPSQDISFMGRFICYKIMFNKLLSNAFGFLDDVLPVLISYLGSIYYICNFYQCSTMTWLRSLNFYILKDKHVFSYLFAVYLRVMWEMWVYVFINYFAMHHKRHGAWDYVYHRRLNSTQNSEWLIVIYNYRSGQSSPLPSLKNFLKNCNCVLRKLNNIHIVALSIIDMSITTAH